MGRTSRDFASKAELRRGRVRRKILSWLRKRDSRKLPAMSRALPAGIQFRLESGLLYVAPAPAPRDDLDGARGILCAILASIPIWLVVFDLTMG